MQYLKGSLDPRGESLDLMDIILRESQRLDQAIRDFLLFARPGRFNPQPTDLVRLVDENVKILSKSGEFKSGHRIETRHDAPEVWAEVDASRIKQVFWNLATNGLKAMPAGGTLTIGVRAPAGGAEAILEFGDDGVGMDVRTLVGYFQPFRSFFEAGDRVGRGDRLPPGGGTTDESTSTAPPIGARVSASRCRGRANYYPGRGRESCIEFTSFINIRPSAGNRGMELQAFSLVGEGEPL